MIRTDNKIIQHKVSLLNLANELGNVSRACKLMGVSRDTFYRYKEAVENGGVESLIDKSRRCPNLKNRVSEEIEEAVCVMAIDYPAWGQERVSNELKKKGIVISNSGVRSIWLRNDLSNFKKRLKKLEEKSAQENYILTEAQIQALEKKRQEDLFTGEIETQHPGYLGSQDTFYVGTLKGVGRVYQQTFVDTYSKVAICKLYKMHTAITAADLLNDKVLPFFEEHNIPMLRILTDRGSEYCGKIENHEYQLYLAINDIDHSKTKAKSPQQNGICERFHKTILNEFYQVAFRKNIYTSIENLQTDLDKWLEYYNNERTHQGKMCCGRTPMQTLEGGKNILKEKIINFQNENDTFRRPFRKEVVNGDSPSETGIETNEMSEDHLQIHEEKVFKQELDEGTMSTGI